MTAYTEEETDYIIKEYQRLNQDNSKIEEIAASINKNKKSVIGKLSREGVYVKKPYRSKTGDMPITKKELVHKVALELDIDPEKIAGLEKSPKMDLQVLLQALSNQSKTVESYTRTANVYPPHTLPQPRYMTE